MKRFLGSMALATMLLGLAPPSTFADGRSGERPFNGSFAVAYTVRPNTAAESYCGAPALPAAIEAHGNGHTSLGTFSFTLFKTGGGGAFHGCLTLVAAGGDSLEATYVAAGLPPNANNFALASGTLTFTGGTGRFKNASGNAVLTAVFANFYPASSFAGGGPANVPLQGLAFYEIEGTILRERR
jgi:hypothetical protein